MNLPEFRQELTRRYPAYQKEIRTLKRSQLNDLCRQLMDSAPISQSPSIRSVSPQNKALMIDGLELAIEDILHEVHPVSRPLQLQLLLYIQ